MKLYMSPVSTMARPVLLYLAENGIDIDQQVVDLMSGEHRQEAFARVNPNCLVPALQDGDFILTECSAILKFLADKYQTADYPQDLHARARVNERMDWFNANFYKDLGYNVVYPQLFPHHRRPTEAAQDGTIEWGLDRCRHWLGILEKDLIGSNDYLCGNEITIADYFGACMLELGKIIGCDYSNYKNVEAWMGRIRKLPNWNAVHEVVYGFAASLEGKAFRAI